MQVFTGDKREKEPDFSNCPKLTFLFCSPFSRNLKLLGALQKQSLFRVQRLDVPFGF